MTFTSGACPRHPRRPALIGLILVGLLLGLTAQAGPLALIGSGRIDFHPHSWSEGIVRWITGQARQGTVLILSGRDELPDLARYFEWHGAARAEYLVMPERYVADNPDVYKKISAADAIVFVDGQCREMVENWRGTRAESAIRDHFAAGRVIAGFGEGAEVLGDLIVGHTASGTTPRSFLSRPVSPTTTVPDFCPLVADTVIFSGFFRRGLLLEAMATLAEQQQASPSRSIRAIGIDEHTALLTEDGHTATILGEGTVSVLRLTASSSVRLDHRLPPVITHVGADLLTEGFVYDLHDLSILAAPPTAISVAAPTSADPFTPLLLDGSKDTAERAGPIALTNLQHDYLALQRGLLKEIRGDGLMPATLVIADGLTNPYLYENQLGGLLWGLGNHPGYTGLFLTAHTKLDVTAAGNILPLPVSDQAAALVFDTRSVLFRDFSRWIAHRESLRKRQSVALTGLVIHQIASRWEYQSGTGAIVSHP